MQLPRAFSSWLPSTAATCPKRCAFRLWVRGGDPASPDLKAAESGFWEGCGGDAACEIRFRDGAGRFVRLSMDEEAFRLCREGIYADRNQRKRDRSHGVLRCCELRGSDGE